MRLDFTEATVSIDEGDLMWVVDFTIDDPGVYSILQKGVVFSLVVMGVEMVLVVDTRSSNRSSEGRSYRVRGVSPAYVLAEGRSSYKNTDYVMASDFVRSVLPGFVVSWEMVDWMIPPYRISLESATPIEAARAVIEEPANGVIESKRDGSLVVRPRTKVASDKLSTVTPDYILSDVEDNISVQEASSRGEVVNRLRLTSGDLLFQDKIVWVEDKEKVGEGVFKVYLSPWRNFTRLVSTGPLTVNITYVGEFVEEVTELVSFKNGEGSVSNPVWGIVDVSWESISLGSVGFTENRNVLTCSKATNFGYGLATVVYVTKSLNYRCVGSDARHLLVYVEDFS